MIECLICHKMYKSFTYHLVAKHGIHSIDYLKLFPGAKISSDETIEKLRNANLGRKATEKTRKVLSLSHLGYSSTEEARKNMSIAAKENKKSKKFKKGDIPWNIGLTKETDIRVKKYSESIINHYLEVKEKCHQV